PAGFKTYGLPSNVLRGIEAAGYDNPRPIQAASIGSIMSGRDLLGLAQTGTGKTAAFVLPILERCLAAKSPGPRALVVAPTRELALQIHGEFETLGRFTNIRSTVVFGGIGQGPQVTALRKRPDVIVACPGRLLDLYAQGAVDFSKVEVLVLDEADHMFDMGFLPDIRRILNALPARRQNLMFSATMPAEIRKLADRVLTDPKVVELAHSSPADTIEHALYPVKEDQKQDALTNLLSTPDFTSAIVFLRTKHRAKRMALKLQKDGHKAIALQGNMSQNQREKAMKGFRSGAFEILVATDIAARGIDVVGVSHVINFDVPNTPDAYVHRIGRTGRSELLGKACTLITHEDAQQVRAIEKRLGHAIERRGIEGLTRVADGRKGPARPAALERTQAAPASKPRRDERPARAERPRRDERPQRDQRPQRDERPRRDERPQTERRERPATVGVTPTPEAAGQPFGAGIDADAARNAARKDTRRRRESERATERTKRPAEPAGPGARRRRSRQRRAD
ncbi:MAG: DEAD/DEAH box helicase, partial [Planctomycetota bacterium]